MESPLRIKYSLGIVRGKPDLLDAQRIASYTSLNVKHLRYWQPEQDVIKRLRELRFIRNRLIAAKVILNADTKVQELFLSGCPLQSFKK